MRLLLAAVVLGASVFAAADLRGLTPPAQGPLTPPAQEVSFNRDIRPILSSTCFKCHGPDLKKGGLDLQTRETALKPAKSGQPAIVPGKSAESELIRRILSHDEQERMPYKGNPLSDDKVRKLRAWIDQGARYEEHWAYVKPDRPALPRVQNTAWVRNPIDAFVLARLEKEGLKPMPEADRHALIRRVSLDLTGLPPTPAEVDAFVSDTSANAYEKVVDRLLASPHYGEHQARIWLDLARYADTNGYEKDDRRTIWPYRDWVIAALNRDLPFDQFTIEQLAGDLLPNATQDQLVATGFHRNTMVNTEGGTDDEEFRVAAVVDRVNTTFAVWLGTTFNCAQCHNHKFDPFSQKEYYGVFAFFNNTTDGGRDNNPTLSLPTPQENAQRGKLRLEQALTQGRLYLVNPYLGLEQARGVGQRLAELRKQEAGIKPASTLVLRELPKPRETHIHIRGEHRNKGEKVTPGTPAKLHALSAALPRNRLGFARWLVSEENPLVGRVVMNRLWAQYFGRGLVETSEDFGAQGEMPSHPELLDWLAAEFMSPSPQPSPQRGEGDKGPSPQRGEGVAGKWSLKAMHRRIVLSATYRQSAKVTKEALERDPQNRLYARGPRYRLDAELVRDNALAVSGLLDRRIGGPSVFPHQPDGVWLNPYSGDRWVTSAGAEQYRRGLYTFWRRTAPYAMFSAFDAPSREVCTERRPRTNTPLQALGTLNDRFFVQAAAGLARRMLAETKGDDAARIAHGFRLCVVRAPTEKEQSILLGLLTQYRAKYAKDAAAAKSLSAILPNPPKEVEPGELASWTVIANVLLNLDETLTK
jgi:mono/diheme cytochrome c family protein